MSDAEVEILYEDGPCLVVNKPPGLLTQSPPGIDSMEDRVKGMLQSRPDRPETIYLGVPHRLDRPASGAIVFATRRKATQRLAQQFESRQVQKTYWACVAGRIAVAGETWEDFVRKVPGEARAEIVEKSHPQARHAVLHYRTLAVAEWGTWLEIELETGRTHQVRIQAASRGHPVLGDAQYGSTIPFGPQHEDERLRAIALHARSLKFLHPKSRETVLVTAPVSQGWTDIGLDVQ